MADNSTVDNGALGTLPVRSIEKSGQQVQVFTLDLGGSGAEDLLSGTLPIRDAQRASSAAAPTSATVGVASSTVVASNTARTGLVLVNDSSLIIYLSLNGDAEVNKGIRLNANGGSFTMQSSTFSTGAIKAIATGAGANLCIQEFS
jgi:hypothetical protein